ncbi:MAG: hypothetical protein N4A53_00340 [Pelagimonas sp.]|jgi:hypothetical protein|nr:hypothetical protein [Pelagimonas sp.]
MFVDVINPYQEATMLTVLARTFMMATGQPRSGGIGRDDLSRPRLTVRPQMNDQRARRD